MNGLIHRSYETHGSVDIEHSPEHLAITSPGSQDVLATMDREFGLVEATRRTAGRPTPNYRLRSAALAALSRAVTYHRRGTDDLDKKIIDHVREYGSISNRTLQRMFDIHVFAALTSSPTCAPGGS